VPSHKKPRPPTKRQREIAERFKGGDGVREIWVDLGRPYLEIPDIEQAIRAVMVWEGRDD
jgi:hypothetical protein